MTLKQEIIDYAYCYCQPAIYDTIKLNIKPYKDDLSDLLKYDDYLFCLIVNNLKNEDLLSRVEKAISTEKTDNLCINSAFIGWIIGFISGVVFCGIVNLIK